MLELELRRSGILDPLIEERPQIETGNRLETSSDVVEGRQMKAVLTVELPQRPNELRVADLLAQHVPDHGGLPVADGFGDGIMAALETRGRKVILRRDVVRDPLQDRTAMIGALAALFSDEMVGEIGGQTLTPVPARKVDEYAITPPVVQQFMGVRRVQNKRKPDDLLAQEREGRHAVARLPEILHQGELGIGIRAQKAPIHIQVLRRRLEVTIRQRLIGRAQKGQRFHRARIPGIFREWRGNQMHLLGRRGNRPALARAGARRVA